MPCWASLVAPVPPPFRQTLNLSLSWLLARPPLGGCGRALQELLLGWMFSMNGRNTTDLYVRWYWCLFTFLDVALSLSNAREFLRWTSLSNAHNEVGFVLFSSSRINPLICKCPYCVMQECTFPEHDNGVFTSSIAILNATQRF